MATRTAITQPTQSTHFAVASAKPGVYIGEDPNLTKVSLTKHSGLIDGQLVRIVQTGMSKEGNPKYTAFSPDTGEIVMAFYRNSAGLGEVEPTVNDRRIVAAMMIEVDDDDLPSF